MEDEYQTESLLAICFNCAFVRNIFWSTPEKYSTFAVEESSPSKPVTQAHLMRKSVDVSVHIRCIIYPF